MNNLKAAYSADKSIFISKIEELEKQIKEQTNAEDQLKSHMKNQELSGAGQKSEINFLNGKCQTLQRDLEYAEKFNEQCKGENERLKAENETLRTSASLQEKEQ